MTDEKFRHGIISVRSHPKSTITYHYSHDSNNDGFEVEDDFSTPTKSDYGIRRRSPMQPSIAEERSDQSVKESDSPAEAPTQQRRVSFSVAPSIKPRISFFSSSGKDNRLAPPRHPASPQKQEDDSHASLPPFSESLDSPLNRPEIVRRSGQLELMTSEKIYQPPTPLHEVCFTARSDDDIRSFLLSANVRGRDLTNTASRQDKRGRLPLHVISENLGLSATLYDHDDQSINSLASPSFTQEFVVHRHVSKFLIDVLLSAYPSGASLEDHEGMIPFERALTAWTERVQEKQDIHIKRNNSLSSFSRRSAAAKDRLHNVWMSTSMSVSTALHWAGRSLHRPNSTTRDESGTTDIPGSENKKDVEKAKVPDDSNLFRFDVPDNVHLTSHAKFAIRMVSLMLDHLDASTRSESFAERVQQHHALQCDSFDAGMDSLHNVKFKRSESMSDVAAQISEKIARIPNFLPFILCLHDRDEREWALSTTLVKRVILRPESIDRWLPSSLQSTQKRVSCIGLQYLQLVSQGIEESTAAEGYKSSNRLVHQEPKADYEELHKKLSDLESFIPSLLALDERGIEEAATTLIVRRVLDTMISKLFAVSVVFFDFMFLATLMLGFRAAVNRFLMGSRPETILQWIYIANIGIFYFLIREIGKGITILERTRQARIYLWSFWNITDIASTLLALISTLVIRSNFSRNLDFDNIHQIRATLAVTTGFLWLRVLSLLKTINMQLATFVLAILQITKDILWFLLILLTLVASFAQMFYTLLLPSSCVASETALENDECSQAEYYLKVYTVLLGDFGHFDREAFQTVFAVALIVFFSFMVVIVLLNVLIAIVSDSYEKCLVRSQCLFGRARVMLVAELVSFQNLLRTNTDKKVSLSSIYSQWKSGEVWNNGMSHGSTYFFCLSTVVVAIWSVGESIGYFRGEQRGVFFARLLSIIINVALFAGIVWFLSSGAAPKKGEGNNDDASTVSRGNFDQGWFQRSILKVLGSSQESTTLRETEEWRGRVDYLQREMLRIAHESNAIWTKHMESMERHVVLSESRIRSELTALEDGLEEFKSEMKRIQMEAVRPESRTRYGGIPITSKMRWSDPGSPHSQFR